MGCSVVCDSFVVMLSHATLVSGEVPGCPGCPSFGTGRHIESKATGADATSAAVERGEPCRAATTLTNVRRSQNTEGKDYRGRLRSRNPIFRDTELEHFFQRQGSRDSGGRRRVEKIERPFSTRHQNTHAPASDRRCLCSLPCARRHTCLTMSRRRTEARSGAARLRVSRVREGIVFLLPKTGKFSPSLRTFFRMNAHDIMRGMKHLKNTLRASARGNASGGSRVRMHFVVILGILILNTLC
jgi:hypothetical protein